MFSGTIINCYDSHLHWLATGQWSQQLSLHDLKKPEDILHKKIEPQHQLGGWVLGFGWDQNIWHKTKSDSSISSSQQADQAFPTRQILDQWCPDQPVALSRVDGHVLWVNTAALKAADLPIENASSLEDPQGGKYIRDEKGRLTGVMIDIAKMPVEIKIPQAGNREIRRDLLKATQILNQAGFTHIRDLSCNPQQWNESVNLDESGLLTLAVEQFFSADDPKDFDKALDLALQARKQRTKNIRAQGLKIYMDGALGSEGAWMSEPYKSGSGHGLCLLKDDELAGYMKKSFENEFDIAVHTLGDEAVDRVVSVALQLKEEGYLGRLHLEHVEVIRPETVKKMKSLDCTAYMQPCHWLSDSKWLEEKIGKLAKHAFPWRALQENEVPFFFGSDSPIEPVSLNRNFEAIRQSAEKGIPKLLGDIATYHSHPDRSWPANTWTRYEDGKVKELVFNGEHIVQNP